MGRGWTSIWSGVEFPSDGMYTLKCEADDWLRIYVDDVEIGNPPDFAAEVYEGVREYKFRASSGIHNIKMDYYNIPGNNRNNFETNPVVFNALITDKVSVTSGRSKPWTENPTGISAVLLPPPCPREVGGKGVVCDVEIINSYYYGKLKYSKVDDQRDWANSIDNILKNCLLNKSPSPRD